MNINSIKQDDGRQKRAQSIDFGEIRNTQSPVGPDYGDKFDQIFHNWDNPDKCRGYINCSICQKLQDDGKAVRQDDDKIYHLNKQTK
jgi:hypothetical protein